MGRHGYSEGDADSVEDMLRMEGYRQAVRMALKGKRGQRFLRELGEALDALPEKKLCEYDLQRADGACCALGAVGRYRGIDMTDMDPEDWKGLGRMFDIAVSMVREIEYENDDQWYYRRPWYPARNKLNGGIVRNERGIAVNEHGQTEVEFEDAEDRKRWSKMREWVRSHVKN